MNEVTEVLLQFFALHALLTCPVIIASSLISSCHNLRHGHAIEPGGETEFSSDLG